MTEAKDRDGSPAAPGLEAAANGNPQYQATVEDKPATTSTSPSGFSLTRTELPELPPILAGYATGPNKERVERFYNSVADIFERWVTRRQSPHTQRAYRTDVLAFIDFVRVPWPEGAWKLLTATVGDVQAWRDGMVQEAKAPKTLNRRISSLSSFYKYLAASAAELRLPITVPNPAHAQFIARSSSDPVEQTHALTATRTRQLMGLPTSDSILDYRDRAIIKTFVYTGARIGTICRLRVKDFHEDDEDSTLRINEKGDKRRTIGIHFAAAEAIREYIKKVGLEGGPLFRARRAPRSDDLGEPQMSQMSMFRVLKAYLERLPGSTKDGESVYTPHSLRATVATLLLDAGVDIRKVQELLGHRHVTTTQIYDKRRRTTKESASHDVPV